MDSQIKIANQSVAQKKSVLLPALFRLALLAAPLAIVVKRTGHNPMVCVIACAVVLGVWLSVDVWPFRPMTAAAVGVKNATASLIPANFGKAQWWSFLFCRVILLGMMFHSRLMV